MKGIYKYKNDNLFIFTTYKKMYQYINYIISRKKRIKLKHNNKIYLNKYLMENILKSFFKKIKLYATD